MKPKLPDSVTLLLDRRVNLLLLFQFGTLSEEMTRANMKLFAEQVAPVLRQANPLSAAAE